MLRIGDRPLSRYVSVMPGYFRTLGIPLRRGREFSDKDAPGGGPLVAIVDETLVRRFWPGYPGGQDPIGRHLFLGPGQEHGIEIVGIVASVREGGLSADTQAETYLPLAHVPVPARTLLYGRRAIRCVLSTLFGARYWRSTAINLSRL